MRSCIEALAVVGILTGCQQTAGSFESPMPFDTQTHIAAWIDLWSTYDLSQVDQLFLTDSTVTYFSSEREGLISGFAAVREHHASFGFSEGGETPDQELWVENLHTSIYGPTAVVTGIWLFGNPQAAPDDIQRGPMTVVYVWDHDDYRIAHMHFASY
ncbi:MAG: hypothetical protein AMS18_05060 [Gemmatimonas sp. SG8_17]|nr:MAG: hypothetical protein AMS18_05060 [Gemmatimonas sp. SG8_17]